MHPAIVLGGGSANGLGIARNLGSQGIPIYCLTSNPRELTQYSKYCRCFHLAPQIEHNPHVLLQVLHRVARHITTPAVLFPTTDAALLSVAALRDQVQEYVTFLPPRHLVELMVVKSRFYQSLAEHKVPHPRTLNPADVELTEVAAILGFPVFIRPVQSLPFFTRFGRKGFTAHTLQELRLYLHVAERHQMPVMLQEIIPGPGEYGYSMRGYLDRRSQVMALMALQKQQQPSLFTPLTVKQSIPLTVLGDAVRIVITYLQAIRYRGLFFAEWKRDPRDGIVKLLEINARSAGGNAFGAACGMNHILLAYREALGLPITQLTHYRTDLCGINLLPNLRYQFIQILRGRFSPRNLLPYFQPKQFLILSWRDGRPFLTMLRQVVADLMGKASWRI